MKFFVVAVALAFLCPVLSIYAQEAPISGEKPDTITLYTIVEKTPAFPGGNNSLQNYLRSAVSIPPAAIKYKIDEKVSVSLVVLPSGEIDQVRISGFLKYSINDSLYFALKKMPKWQPGIHNNKKVKVIIDLPVIHIDYKNGLTLDSVISDLREWRAAQFKIRIKALQDYFSYLHPEHSLFYDDAIECLKNKNYAGALKKLNHALVADPYDATVLQTRALTYYELGDSSLGCADQKFGSYLNELKDSLMIDNSFSYCIVDYFFNREYFLSDGIIPPDLFHDDEPGSKTEITPPLYPGGLDSLYSFLGSHFHVEKDVDYSHFNSRILVRFTVFRDGTTKFKEIIHDDGSLLAKEAYRLFNLTGNWIPAKQNNQAIDIDYIFPLINFKYRRKEYFARENFHYNAGVAFLNQKKYDQALEQFTLAIRKDSMDLDSYYNRGICNFKMGSKDLACHDWSFAAFYFDQNAIKLLNRFCDSTLIVNRDTLSTSPFILEQANDSLHSASVPVYPGGNYEMQKFVTTHLKPEKIFKKFTGTIYISCIISKSGRVVQPKIISLPRNEIDAEALRILNLMPLFIPAKKNDMPVDKHVIIHMRFETI